MSHMIGDLLLAAGAALIVLDVIVATSTQERNTLLIRLQRAFPNLSGGLAVVLVCAMGTVVITIGLDLLTRT